MHKRRSPGPNKKVKTEGEARGVQHPRWTLRYIYNLLFHKFKEIFTKICKIYDTIHLTYSFDDNIRITEKECIIVLLYDVLCCISFKISL